MIDDLHHLAAAYALDAVTLDERRAFEAHYPSCEICTVDVADYREVAGQLAAAAADDPPSGLRAGVLTEIAQTRQVSPIDVPSGVSRRLPKWGYLAAAAALILVIGAVVAVVNRDTDEQFGDQFAALVAEPDAVLLPLESDEPGSISVVWSESRGQAAVIGDGVESVAADSRYALWLLDDTGAQPAGLFAPDPDGGVALLVDLTDRPAGWGVTIEPESGSPQPTGDILFAAQI